MTYRAIESAAAKQGLAILGGFHPANGETLLLLGPAGNFWEVFCASPEAAQADPVDQWSARVIPLLAAQFEASAALPFGGPPFEPFLSWAMQSGRCWSSPVGMLVHDTTGLMVSFRGALRLSRHLDLPVPPPQSPCKTCTSKPCLQACPVNALGQQGYDTAKCHSFLDKPEGRSCLSKGCAARRACPLSMIRPDAQSAHHMSYFHH